MADNNDSNLLTIKEALNDQYNIVTVLADIIVNRGKGKIGRVERISKLMKILVCAMKEHKTYINDLKDLDIDLLCSSARLYDIGKIFIPDSILNKPDRLTSNEFEIMKTHSIKGENIISEIAFQTKANVEFFNHAKLLAGYHHERWDGNGYPRKLDRLNIPIHGRIMTIIDVYDALISERPYKQPFTPVEAGKIIVDSAGEMFDPLITDVFFEIKDQIYNV